VFVSWCGVGALQALLPNYLPRLANVAIDWRVLGLAAGSALVTGVAFGLAPVFQSGRTVSQAARETVRTDTSSGRRQRLRSAFLVAEVALAVVLVVGAILFLTSFARLMRIELGLDYRQVLVVDVRPKDGSTARFTSLLEQVRRLPGVELASLATDNLPFSGRRSGGPNGVGVSRISPDYFRVLDVPLRGGRLFNDADGPGDRVVILNEAAAKVYFPDHDPVGRSIQGSRTVVGVVGNVRAFGPERQVEPDQFYPASEADLRRATLVLKTRKNDPAIVTRVKAAIWAEFPDVIIPAPQTLERALAGFIAQRRFNMMLLGAFGLLALTIAGVGIYGVMAYIVTQRTREIGIRMALGALASTILWSVLRRAATQVGVGLIGGLVASWLLATSVQSFLFKVEPRDLRLYAAVCAVLAVTALAAAYLPARRAARVDPLVALRLE
jgi:predicted permease